jgi:hypothetical protein
VVHGAKVVVVLGQSLNMDHKRSPWFRPLVT